MSNCLELDSLPKEDPSEGAIVAKKLFLMLLGMAALGYLGYSFGELFPILPEAKIIGCIAAIILGILVRRYEQSLPRIVIVQCYFCLKWVDIAGILAYRRIQKEREVVGLCCPSCKSYDYPFRHGWSPVER